MPSPNRQPTDTRPEQRRHVTPQQRAVLEALERSDKFRSAQQLHAELLADTAVRVGLTSVYRILHQLTHEQLVETQRAEDGGLLYRLRHTTIHHHNLLCRICGRAEQFTLDILELHTRHIAQHHRYADVDHHIDLYGICPDCAVGQHNQSQT